MATITSLGAGSGLDLEGIVRSLMQVERQSIRNVESKQADVRSEISAFGQVSSALSKLQTAAKGLSEASGFAAYKGARSDESVLSASFGTDAQAGDYRIEVSQLAQRQSIATTGYASSAATVPTGSLLIELGSMDGGVYTADAGRTASVPIGANTSLAGLRDAINTAGLDVTASIVNDGSANPARLVITPKDGGTDNVIRLSGVAGLAFDPENVAGSDLEQPLEAKDAQLEINGIPISRGSNEITDAIEGVTLNLTKTNIDNPMTLSVTNDTDAIKKKLDDFAAAYNEVNSVIRSLTSYNVDNNSAGALNGDYTVRQIRDSLRTEMSQTLATQLGGYTRLSEIGISFSVDGTMSVDGAKVTDALNDPDTDLATLFTGNDTTDGFAKLLSSRLDQFLGSDGAITKRTDSLNSRTQLYSDQIDTLEVRMEAIEKRYRAQFSSLDTMIASMNSTSTYLAQQLTQISALSRR